MRTQTQKAKLPVIDNIGGLEVTEFRKEAGDKGWPLLNMDDLALGVRKVRAVVNNIEACKAFLAKYDIVKVEVKVDPAEAARLATENATLLLELETLRAKITAKPSTKKPARFTPAKPAELLAV